MNISFQKGAHSIKRNFESKEDLQVYLTELSDYLEISLLKNKNSAKLSNGWILKAGFHGLHKLFKS